MNDINSTSGQYVNLYNTFQLNQLGGNNLDAFFQLSNIGVDEVYGPTLYTNNGATLTTGSYTLAATTNFNTNGTLNLLIENGDTTAAAPTPEPSSLVLLGTGV